MKIKVISPGLFIPLNYGNMAISSITLLEHERYKVLVDVGGYGQRNALLKGLQDLQISPQEITHVFITHLHWDHFVNFDLFPEAIFMISEEEFKDLEGKDRRDIATPHQILNILQSIKHVQTVQDNIEVFPFTTSILTPGHTKGHMSLLIESNERVYCVAGDAVTNLESVKNNSPSLAFYDLFAAQHSVKKIKELADVIIPGHDNLLCKAEDGTWGQYVQVIDIE